MKSIIMVGPRKSKVIEIDIPKPSENQLLVKVIYTGMCHSEWYPWTIAKQGDRFGHEPMGVVADVGRNVKGFKIGDRVTGYPGGYNEYILMDQDKTIHIPDNLSDEDAQGEPLACLISAASKMPIITPGDSVAVVGAGYMGLGMISLFKLKGAGKIVAVDLREEARENALRFGATEVYSPENLPREYLVNWDSMKADLSTGASSDIFNSGFKTVMEFAGTESALRLAGDMVCAHGRLGIGGYHLGGDRKIDYKLWNYKAITSINTHERDTTFLTHCCQNAIDLLSSGLWNFKGISNHIYSMEELDKANEDMETKPKGYIKALIRCSE